MTNKGALYGRYFSIKASIFIYVDILLNGCIVNALKMRSVIIEGAVGCGKSTVLKAVQEKLGTKVMVQMEPLEIWRDYNGHNLLKNYYDNVSNASAGGCHAASRNLQLVIMLTMAERYISFRQELKQNKKLKYHLLERSMLCAKDVFIKGNKFSAIDKLILHDYCNYFIDVCNEKSALKIYLKASMSTLEERIRRRSRPEELKRMTYMDQLTRQMDHWGWENCHYILYTDDKTPEQLATEIITIIMDEEKRGCAPVFCGTFFLMCIIGWSVVFLATSHL